MHNTTVQPVQTQAKRDDELTNRYFRESIQLQSDIYRLEQMLKEERTNRNNSIVTNTAVAPVLVPVKRDTLFIRDTIWIRDTTKIINNRNIIDTVIVVKRDTIEKRIETKPQTIYVPVEKETIIKEKIDYTKLPPETILFALGNATVRPVYNGKLNFIAGVLMKNEALKLSITGHTDKTGSPEVNERLSLKRANSVKQFFVEKGIAENRINIEALASAFPVLTGKTKQDAGQNRRVVIMVMN